jgi:hypothetical protein
MHGFNDIHAGGGKIDREQKKIERGASLFGVGNS